jgi:pyruvate-ferredoxin/flavodoxin oxidoreductase
MLKALKKGGSFLLNTTRSAEELDEFLPGQVKRYIAENDIDFYIIDAVRLAQEIGLRNRINTICQAAFFKITEVIPVDEAVKHMKDAIVRSYGDKGEEIVNMNYRAVDAGIAEVQKVDVPAEWRDSGRRSRQVPRSAGIHIEHRRCHEPPGRRFASRFGVYRLCGRDIPDGHISV